MSRRTSIVLESTIAGFLLLILAAWAGRVRLVGYMRDRAFASVRGTIAQYLTGTVPLDSSATRLNEQLDSWLEWDWRYTNLTTPQKPGAGNTATITSTSWAPFGVRDDDPRIFKLFYRGMYLRLVPAASPR